MNRLLSILVLGALLAIAAPVAAQEHVAQASPGDGAQASPESATLEALCQANAADAAEEGLCLYVVHQILVPGSGPGSEGYGVGDAQYRDGMRIKPLKVDWNADPSRTWRAYGVPKKGMKFVAVLVEYTAGEGFDDYYETSWRALDRDGLSQERPRHGVEPELGYGRIRPGETIRGWVTFEVPRKTKWLEVRYEQPLRDPLYWVLRDEKRK
jgi:hypothetical protein